MESILDLFTELYHLICLRQIMTFQEMKTMTDLYFHTFYYLVCENDKIKKSNDD